MSRSDGLTELVNDPAARLIDCAKDILNALAEESDQSVSVAD